MNDLGALLWLYTVVVVQNQASGTLAAWHAGLEAVALYHSQWHVHVKAGYGTWGSTFVKHKAPLHWTAHSCGRQRQRRNNERLWPLRPQGCDVSTFTGDQ